MNLKLSTSRLISSIGLFAALLLAVSGITVIAYPYFVHWQQDRLSAKLVQSFDEGHGVIEIGSNEWTVSGEELDTLESVVQVSESLPLTTGQPEATTAALPTPTPTPVPEEVKVYAIAKIIIPKIDLKMPIAEGATNVTLRVAIGHYSPSVKFGEVGQSILLGHRMYTYGRFFNRLDELAVDDEIQIETSTERQTYKVTQTEIVLPSDLGPIFGRTYEEPCLMLVTCTPVRVATHRLLVTCKLVSREPLGQKPTTASTVTFPAG